MDNNNNGSYAYEVSKILSETGIMKPFVDGEGVTYWYVEDHENLPHYCYLIVRDFVSWAFLNELEKYVDVMGVDFVTTDAVGKILIREKY